VQTGFNSFADILQLIHHLYHFQMQLYIDTNIYLEYFRENSAERLAPLRELLKLLEAKKVKLLVPSQTREEYLRNKNRIAEATRSALFKKQNEIKFVTPAMLDDKLKAVKEVKKNSENLKKAYRKLIKKYDEALEKEETDAEVLIRKVFELGEAIEETEVIVERAYSRYMKGSPPRKNDNSYGDAIIWETLLEKGKNEKLTIISKDSDFIDLFKGAPVLSRYLLNEWKIKRKKGAVLYRSLAEVVNKLNKNKPIKKEIVQQEKDQPYSTQSPTQFLNGVSYSQYPVNVKDLNSLVFQENSMQNPPWVVAASGMSNSLIVNSSPFSMNLTNTASFCPYCGKRAESQPFGGFRCTSCGRDFHI